MILFPNLGIRNARRAGGWLWWGPWLALAIVSALFLAWRAFLSVDFLYPLWYDEMHIDQTIARYGPQNRNRSAFESTTRAERIRLFGAIVDGIQRQDTAWETLRYHDPGGRSVASLLTHPEIVHLQDVARLVRVWTVTGWAATLAWLTLTLIILTRRPPMPSVRGLLIGTGLTATAITLAVLLAGPVKVFYRLHTWIFPPGHPWFFYYQDSLMTLLMKAPDLFAGIAALWAGLALLSLVGMVFLTQRGLRRLAEPARGRQRHD